MPAISPMAMEAPLKSLASNEYPALPSAVHVEGPTPFVVPHRKASQSKKPESNTRPGSAAEFGRTCPAPWRKITSGCVLGPSRISDAEVISADLMAIGDQSGCRSANRAARPATCGLDMEVPLRRLKSRPALPGGATAARMSCPGAITSGLSRSPPPALSGPREENEAVRGAGALKTIVDALMIAVAPAVAA